MWHVKALCVPRNCLSCACVLAQLCALGVLELAHSNTLPDLSREEASVQVARCGVCPRSPCQGVGMTGAGIWGTAPSLLDIQAQGERLLFHRQKPSCLHFKERVLKLILRSKSKREREKCACFCVHVIAWVKL